MRARAPGKVVLSGAYAVLEGAPCIVTAVDRYVTADSRMAPEHIADEVRAAMPPPFPHVDASELRESGRKLGLGSSAAIVVASLAASGRFDITDAQGLLSLYEHASAAHRRAQGGGSGVDVAAATFGGTLAFSYDPAGPGETAPIVLPPLHLEIWSCPEAAVTRGFLGQVRRLKQASPGTYAKLISRLSNAARQAIDACAANAPATWLEALHDQASGLAELGACAGLPIFTPEVADLHEQAKNEGALVMPAGAGGGDLALFCSVHPPSDSLVRAARDRNVTRLAVTCGAQGVHLCA